MAECGLADYIQGMTAFTIMKIVVPQHMGDPEVIVIDLLWRTMEHVAARSSSSSINQEYTGYFIRYNLSFPRSCGSPFQYLGLTLDELLQWESHMNAHRQYCALLVMMCSLLTFYIGVNAV